MKFAAPSKLPVHGHHPSRTCFKTTTSKAFSLVEVALAVGIVAFSMLAVVGSVPVSLQSVRDSMVDTAKANIANHLYGEMQQISFGTTASGVTNIDGMAGKTYYYSQEGMFVADLASGEAAPANAYYVATFTINQIGSNSPSTANVSDGTGTPGYVSVVDASFQSDNARSITVMLKFPVGAAQQKQAEFSLLSAMQRR